MDIFNGVELSDEQKEQLQNNLNTGLEGFVSRDEFEAVSKKKDELLSEKKAEAEKRRAAEEAANEKALEAAKKNGDIESLTNSFNEKINALTAEIDGYKAEKKTTAIGDIAKQFVDENVTSDAVVREAITNDLKNRLDLREGKPVVLDAEGNLTALTTDDLFTEFKNASKYKPHLVASKASGGGASGSNGSGAAGGNLAEKSLADCKTPEERMQVLKARTGEA